MRCSTSRVPRYGLHNIFMPGDLILAPRYAIELLAPTPYRDRCRANVLVDDAPFGIPTVGTEGVPAFLRRWPRDNFRALRVIEAAPRNLAATGDDDDEWVETFVRAWKKTAKGLDGASMLDEFRRIERPRAGLLAIVREGNEYLVARWGPPERAGGRG